MEQLKIKVDVLEKLKVVLKKQIVELSMDRFFMTRNFEENGILYTDLYLPGKDTYIKAIKENSCNTSCCIAGLIPFVDERYFAEKFSKLNDVEYMDFVKISRDVLGDDITKPLDSRTTAMKTWEFIFAQTWNDNVDFAIERIDYVIKHKRMPNIAGMTYFYEKNSKR